MPGTDGRGRSPQRDGEHPPAWIGCTTSSEPTFSKYFKRATGQNFSDLVRKLRLAHARRLLEYSDKAISAICCEVGFSNLSNFNRHFLNDAGETPRDYRQRV